MALNAQSTQDFVPIKEVRDGIAILKNGELRAIVMASSINLSLKSYDEQQAVLLQFQSFLNSLDFSTQIVIQSRRLDIRPYILLLETQLNKQTEPLLKVQTREYIEFIRQFTEDVAIMTKTFYVVVPYGGGLTVQSSGLGSFFGKKETAKEKQENFEELRTQIEQRIATVQQGLARMGVRSVSLGTEETIEVLYRFFNPGESNKAITAQ